MSKSLKILVLRSVIGGALMFSKISRITISSAFKVGGVVVDPAVPVPAVLVASPVLEPESVGELPPVVV